MSGENNKILYECFICERRFQFGRYVYEGNFVAEWGLNVCHACRANSWNGIDLNKYPHVEHILKFRSVPFKLNARGLLAIPAGKAPPGAIDR